MIGIFDSGVGGLTVLRAMRASYPSIDIIYFGDTARAPYGSRPRQELTQFTVEGIRFLIEHGATSIVSACNSVSASLALSLYDVLALKDIPIIEMVGPCVSAFKGSTARVALCATEATIESGLYQSAFKMIGRDIGAVAIPDLAGAIEKNAGEEAYERIIRSALASLSPDTYDVLVLACTHYPLVAEVFSKVVGKPLYDPADAVAQRVARELWPREMAYGRSRFYLSGESEQFRHFARTLFGDSEYSIEVV